MVRASAGLLGAIAVAVACGSDGEGRDPVSAGGSSGSSSKGGTGNGGTEGNVRLQLPPGASELIVYAAGNTWDPASGADSDGKYALVDDQTVLDVTTSALPNYFFVTANGTLRLAEAACVPTDTCP